MAKLFFFASDNGNALSTSLLFSRDCFSRFPRFVRLRAAEILDLITYMCRRLRSDTESLAQYEIT